MHDDDDNDELSLAEWLTDERRLVLFPAAQLAFICSKLTIEALEQGVKYFQR